ncbi:MAG TPA: FAD-dependent oxidoreductase, partial [Allosphingosinicella sp.]
FIEPGRYLRQLLREFRTDGGNIRVVRFADSAALAALPEGLIFNCTGLGARDLFGDSDLRPARGQYAMLLPQPEIQYAFTGRAGHMFPRPDGIYLGGTFELDEWSTEPRQAAIDRIIASHARLFGALRCA